MGLWHVPEKILLPAEPGGISTFEFNGRLANGDQVMAYTQGMYDYPSNPPAYRGDTAVLFRFDADGVLRTVDFASARHDPQHPDHSRQTARLRLEELVSKVKKEGWVSADILVRLFLVKVDGLATGLIYTTAGQDENDDYSEEEVRLIPFDKIFYRPWTNGEYDT